MSGVTTEPRERRFEDYPLTRSEYITAMVHFYRAEVARSTAWRQRLDATTNWAVLTAAGMMSYAFSSPLSPHFIIPLSNLLLLVYLAIEARRFRYFAVYRARVRMLEENFFVPIITRHLESPMRSWRDALAGDLDLPTHKTTFLQAVGFRLWRNYLWIYLMLFGGWVVKLMIHPHLALSWREIWDRLAVGHFPPALIVSLGLGFYAMLAAVMAYGRRLRGAEPEDEIAGFEQHLENWKI